MTRKRSVVHLFDFDRGSRFNLMIAQGLAAHPEIDACYSSPVHSLGTVTAKPATDLRLKLLGADYVFRPNDLHYPHLEMDGFFDATVSGTRPSTTTRRTARRSTCTAFGPAAPT